MRIRRSLTAAVITFALTATTLSAATRDAVTRPADPAPRASIVAKVKLALTAVVRAFEYITVPRP